MNKDRNARAFATRAIVASVLLCFGTAHADYLLEPPVSVDGARILRMATSSDGRAVLVTWSEPNGTKFRRSDDGGATFGPANFIARTPSTIYVPTLCPLFSGRLFCSQPLFDLEFTTEYGIAPVISADGRSSHVMAGLITDTGARPAFGLAPNSRITSMSLHNDTGLGFLTSKAITKVADTCATQGDLGCAGLRDYDLAADDTASRFVTVFNAYGYSGEEGETWIARGEAGRAFSTPINLSALLLGTRAGNDFRPHVAMDAAGSRVFVTWVEQTQSEGERMHLARSLDGGASFTLLASELATYDADVDCARDSGALFWAYQTGSIAPNPPEPSAIVVRRSPPDGAAMGAPVAIARQADLGGGNTLQVRAPVRVAASRDGRTIAVLHSEEVCSANFGCRGGSGVPFDVVLSISEDGGTTFERVGTIAQTHFDASYDLSITADGGTVFVIAADAGSGTSMLARATRW